MSGRLARIVGCLALWAALAAATPLPLTAPPPDLTPLVQFAVTPLDKPPIDLPDVAMPAPPVELETLPPVPVMLPEAERPMAPLPPVPGYPCVGITALPIASRALECGKQRFLKGDYGEAVEAFEAAVQRGADRDFINQARYWLGESLVRLRQFEQADWTLGQIAVGPARTEWDVWAAHASGWLALRLRDPRRARDTFARLGAGALPATIQGWAAHGLGLAHYALGEYSEAERVWADLGRRGVPPVLAREYAFWFGEVSARVGQPARGRAELARFIQGGNHSLLDTALIRLGWAALAAGQTAESASAFQTVLASGRRPANAPEMDWAQVGLGLALARTGDANGARDAARALLARQSVLGVPVALEVLKGALDAGRTADVLTLAQDLLAARITPAVRAWVLLAKAQAFRLDGNRDDARTQYELAQRAEPASRFAQYAGFRLARTNFEMREFTAAVGDVAAMLPRVPSSDMRVAALLLQGEAAYHAGVYAVADAAFRRVLVEAPQHREAPTVRLSLAWVAYRQQQRDEARQLFLDFARVYPDHAAAADALVVAAELAIQADDLQTARRELDRIVIAYPAHPRTDFARLNLGILMVRQGQLAAAQKVLREWIARAPFAPLLGRAHLVLGVALLSDNQPAEAVRHFTVAQREGGGAYAHLGLGVAALMQNRPDDAARALAEARDTGTAQVMAVAEYGLAAVSLAKGALRDFRAPALAALRGNPAGRMVPQLLYVLIGISADEQDWSQALDLARKLVAEFPNDETADDALERVGAAAARAEAWPVVRESYSLMRHRYPTSPFLATARPLLAEAELRTGRAEDAQRALEQFLASPRTGATDPQHWLLLARAREQTGDRRGAIEAYARAVAVGAAGDGLREAQLGQVRLLMLETRWSQARAVLADLLQSRDQGLVLEAAFGIGETYRHEGDPIAATEYYMTAGYLAPQSSWGRKGLLAAAQSFAAARDPDAAATIYRKLLGQADLPVELADTARQGLQALGR